MKTSQECILFKSWVQLFKCLSNTAYGLGQATPWGIKQNTFSNIYIFFFGWTVSVKVVLLMCCKQEISWFTNIWPFLFSHIMRRFLRFFPYTHRRTYFHIFTLSKEYPKRKRSVAIYHFRPIEVSVSRRRHIAATAAGGRGQGAWQP